VLPDEQRRCGRMQKHRESNEENLPVALLHQLEKPLAVRRERSCAALNDQVRDPDVQPRRAGILVSDDANGHEVTVVRTALGSLASPAHCLQTPR